jgi:hypothetical protein
MSKGHENCPFKYQMYFFEGKNVFFNMKKICRIYFSSMKGFMIFTMQKC